jgi:hypothetical protein
MATLSNPTFEIDLLTGMPGDAVVTGTVYVDLEPLDTFLIGGGLSLELQASIWGEDGGLNGTDEQLFLFPSQNITAEGTYTFTTTVSRGILNEDSSIFDQTDEVYSHFNLVSKNNIFPLNTSTSSPFIDGKF